MRRAKFKFPGRQKTVVSRNWGFTKYNRDDYVQWKREGRLVNDGVNAKVRPSGPFCPSRHMQGAAADQPFGTCLLTAGSVP